MNESYCYLSHTIYMLLPSNSWGNKFLKKKKKKRPSKGKKKKKKAQFTTSILYTVTVLKIPDTFRSKLRIVQNVKGRKRSKNNVVNSIIHNETARVQIKICWVNSISKLQLCFLKRLLPWRGHLCRSNLTGPHPTSCCWCSYEQRWIQWIHITALQADVRFPNKAVSLSAHSVITSVRCAV